MRITPARSRRRSSSWSASPLAARASSLCITSATMPQFVYKRFHVGELRGLKVGGAVRIDRDSLDADVAAHQNVQPQVEAPGAIALQPEPFSSPLPPRRKARRREMGYRHVLREG